MKKEVIVTTMKDATVLENATTTTVVVSEQDSLSKLQCDGYRIIYDGSPVDVLTIIVEPVKDLQDLLFRALIKAISVPSHVTGTLFKLVIIPIKKASLIVNGDVIREVSLVSNTDMYKFINIHQHMDLIVDMMHINLREKDGHNVVISRSTLLELAVLFNLELDVSSKKFDIPVNLMEQLFYERNSAIFAINGFTCNTKSDTLIVHNDSSDDEYKLNLAELRKELTFLEKSKYATFWDSISYCTIYSTAIPFPYVQEQSRTCAIVNCVRTIIEHIKYSDPDLDIHLLYSKGEYIHSSEIESMYSSLDARALYPCCKRL